MILALALILLVLIVAMIGARRVTGLRWLGWVAATLLVYLVGQVLWWFALFFHIVPVDVALARRGVLPNAAVGAAVYFGPPVVVAMGVLVACVTRRR